MANGPYTQGIKNFALGNIVWKAAGGSTIKTLLIDSADYIVNLSTHETLTDVAAAAREEISGGMTLVDAANDGVCDANDVVFTGTSGDACEGILVEKDTGVDGTSLLIAWWDTASGLPVTLGGDVTVSWNASGLFKI